MQSIENLILHNLQHNEDYARKVFPYLKDEYFHNNAEKQYFIILNDYFQKYNALPSFDVVSVEIQNSKLTEQQFDNIIELTDTLKTIKRNEAQSSTWLLEKTEEFCKNRALYNALSDAIIISQDEKTEKSQLLKTAIPDLLSSALAISFDTNIGHDYVDGADARYQYYNRKAHKIPSHLNILNVITGGGFERKTINCIAAATGIGKSMLLCDLAAGYIKNGYKILYITLEMAEEKIAQRIDANILNIPLSKFDALTEDDWKKKKEYIQKTCSGKLIVKEYPTATAHVGNFRFLLRELKQKKGFTPDVIIIDYLNICASSKYKDKSNSYGYIKSICEELRGFAVENNVVLLTATQLNRGGTDNSDADITHISESMGGPMTFDLLLALINSEELAISNQIMVKQLKNRYEDLMAHNKFLLGVDRPKMKFYDTQQIQSQNTTTNSKMKTLGNNNKSNTNKPSNNKFANIQV